MASEGVLAAEQAGEAGLLLDDWQRHALDVALAIRGDGKWAARQVGLIVPRQNGKGSILEAIELYHLRHVESTRLIIHSAHEFSTSSDAFRRLEELLDGAPDIKRRIKKVHRSHGQEGIEFHDGRRIKFKTRTAGGGRGFSGDLVILDEAYNLSDKAISALGPTMSAMPNPQLWVTSSHPYPVGDPLEGPKSAALRRFCRRGRQGAKGLAYIEYAAEEGADRESPGARQAANPGYPFRIDDEAIDGELVLMLPEDFDRERLGIVDISDEVEGGWKVIPLARWVACEDKGSELVGEPSFALDVSPEREWASLVVAGKSSHGGVHLEVADRLEGTAGVVARCVESWERWGRPIALMKGSPAWSLKDALEEAGVTVRAVSLEENAQACGDLFDAIKDQQVRHLGDPVLDEAVKRVDRRPYSDTWLWSRKNSGADISALVAATAARWVFLHDSVAAEPPVYAY